MSFLGQMKTPILDASSSPAGSVRLSLVSFTGVSFVRYDLCQRAMWAQSLGSLRFISASSELGEASETRECHLHENIPSVNSRTGILQSLIPGFQHYKCPTCHLPTETLLLSMKCHFSLNSLTSLQR